MAGMRHSSTACSMPTYSIFVRSGCCLFLENSKKDILEKKCQKMQLKMDPKNQDAKNAKIIQKNANSFLQLKLKCKNNARKMQTNLQKNARNLQQFLYLSCNILGNRNFHFFCILHYEIQK